MQEKKEAILQAGGIEPQTQKASFVALLPNPDTIDNVLEEILELTSHIGTVYQDVHDTTCRPAPQHDLPKAGKQAEHADPTGTAVTKGDQPKSARALADRATRLITEAAAALQGAVTALDRIGPSGSRDNGQERPTVTAAELTRRTGTFCAICKINPLRDTNGRRVPGTGRGRCPACHQHWRRHGTERPSAPARQAAANTRWNRRQNHNTYPSPSSNVYSQNICLTAH